MRAGWPPLGCPRPIAGVPPITPPGGNGCAGTPAFGLVAFTLAPFEPLVTLGDAGLVPEMLVPGARDPGNAPGGGADSAAPLPIGGVTGVGLGVLAAGGADGAMTVPGEAPPRMGPPIFGLVG